MNIREIKAEQEAIRAKREVHLKEIARIEKIPNKSERLKEIQKYWLKANPVHRAQHKYAAEQARAISAELASGNRFAVNESGSMRKTMVLPESLDEYFKIFEETQPEPMWGKSGDKDSRLKAVATVKKTFPEYTI